MIVDSTVLVKSLGLSSLLESKGSLQFSSHFRPSLPSQRKGKNERFQKKRVTTRNGWAQVQ